MIKRVALLVGSLAAAGVLALGLAAAGYGPVTTLEDSGVAGDQALFDDAAGAVTDAVVQVETETVYVKPAPEPRVIHVTRKVSAKKAAAANTSARAKRSGDDDDDDEHEEREHEEREHEGEDD